MDFYLKSSYVTILPYQRIFREVLRQALCYFIVLAVIALSLCLKPSKSKKDSFIPLRQSKGSASHKLFFFFPTSA